MTCDGLRKGRNAGASRCRNRHITPLKIGSDVLRIVGQLLEQLLWRTRWPQGVFGQTMLHILLEHVREVWQHSASHGARVPGQGPF